MKKQLSALLTAALCASCAAVSAAPTYLPGTYVGSSQGFGGLVNVEITVDETGITAVKASGDAETPEVGGKALETLCQAILDANSSQVDTVAGATITSKAVLEAAGYALDQAGGKEAAQAVMLPGEYTGEGYGYSLGEPVRVKVTVDEDHILTIDVDADNAETEPVFNAALAIVDRMIEEQSVAVDSVTGATLTSGAIRTAVEQAVKDALAKGGSDESAIQQFMKADEASHEVVEMNTNVVVVGMGAAGLSAMTRTAELLNAEGKPVNIIALEKNGYYGGCSLMASDYFGVNPKRHEEKFNNGKDFMDADVMKKIWFEYTEGDGKQELIDLMVDYSGETLDWLEFDHDYQFVEKAIEGMEKGDHYAGRIQYLPNDNAAVNKPAMYRYFTNLVDDFTNLGGQYMLETEAYDLIYDEQTKTVQGVKARSMQDGTEYVIHASKVILASGGFADNDEMTTQYLKNDYYPLSGAWNKLSTGNSDGKMVQAAIDIGAGTYNIGITPMVHLTGAYKQISGFETHVVEDKIGTITNRTAMWSENDVPKYMVISPYSVAVNRFGERFATEERIGFLDSWKAGPYFYSLWSQKQIDEIRESGFDSASLTGPSVAWLGYRDAVPADYITTREHLMALPMSDRYVTCMPDHTPIAAIDDIMQAGIKAGFVFKADTLDELADMLGMDAATLHTTIDTFNGYCESGTDADFGKSEKYLRPLDAEGPYYAVMGSAYCYATCGALDINENLQVLAADGQTPIEGLYAIGNDSCGVLYSEKKAYVTYGGAAQGWAYTSGYVCGEIIANELSK